MQAQYILILPPELKLTGLYLTTNHRLDALPEIDTHERAWAAGFFDGEGCSYVSRPTRNVQLCTEVNQIHPEVLERFQRAVGGVGSMRLRPDKTHGRHSPMWSFYTRRWQDTQVVLILLWPYLDSIKRGQATRAFAEYQQEARMRPKLGRPNLASFWTETACPRGHTDIYLHPNPRRRIPERRCRICRRENTTVSYKESPNVPRIPHFVHLTIPQVLEIRAKYAQGTRNNELADLFQVSRATITNVTKRLIYQDV